MLYTLMGERGDYPPPMGQVRFGQAEPYCVRWETGEEPKREFGDIVSPAVARLASRLAAWVWAKRADPVLLENTDGEPMVLIDAAVVVDGDVAERLFERSDFGEEENGEDGQLVWWGERVDDGAGQPDALHFHEDGSVHVIGPDDEEEHVVLARLTPAEGGRGVAFRAVAGLRVGSGARS
jgi:hypothetical protein